MRWHSMLLALPLLLGTLPAAALEVTIGSKAFTESVILGELLGFVARDAGASPHHHKALGGTRILYSALKAGEIDIYPEYTGTLIGEILADRNIASSEELAAILADEGLRLSPSLGFQNTYALAVPKPLARQLNLQRISDLRAHPDLRLGFSNEFLDREDGWPGLAARYRLPQQRVQALDHHLAYRGIGSGRIDVTVVYTTDAEIAHYDLTLLEDDLGYFPSYRAVLLYRADLAKRAPALVATFNALASRIDESTMADMNAAVKLDGATETQTAAAFAREHLGLTAEARQPRLWDELRRRTIEHLALVSVSLLAAIMAAIPLGILAAHRPALGQLVLAATGIFQTIPSLALFVFLIPFLGIGWPPTVAALFLYSLLPIVRNTHAGLTGIPLPIRESADVIGLTPGARLRLVELPLAAGTILAGIKTAAVINVGTATLAALIGAGGYGQPILTGIRLDDTALIMQGAIPAALLALGIQGLFELAEHWVVPRGLRRRARPAD